MLDQGSSTEEAAHDRFLRLLDRATWPRNDISNAKRLKTILGDKVIHVGHKGWAVWHGRKYSFEGAAMAIERLAQKLQDLALEEADAIVQFVNQPMYRKLEECKRFYFKPQDVDKHRNFAQRCGNTSAYKHALDALAPDMNVLEAKIDAAPHLFNVGNGTIDLKALVAARGFPRQRKQTRETMDAWASAFFGPHQRDHFPTRASDVDYDPMAKCPEFRAFMGVVFPDKEVRDCFQRCAGAMLYGSNESQAMLILRGNGGNGKSTLMTVLSSILKDYATTCKTEVFMKVPIRHASGPSPELVRMTGARMLNASEPDPSDILSGKAIKTLTGGDEVAGRAAYAKEEFVFRPTALPVLSCNRTPRLTDDDEGVRRRLVFVPFDVSLHKLPEKERRHPEEIKAALAAERSGILNWMLDGYRAYAARLAARQGIPMGIDPPPRMIALRDRYLEQADPVGLFLEATVSEASDKSVPLGDLYGRYEDWAEKNGMAGFSTRRFRTALIEKGYDIRKSGGYAKVFGLSLNPDP